MSEQQTLKRRGLIAGAAALVVGIATRRGEVPVRALTDTSFTASGGGAIGFATTISGYDFGVSAFGATNGVFGYSSGSNGVFGNTSTGNGVRGSSTSGNGMFGDSSAGGGYGVQGFNSAGIGVYGHTSAPANTGWSGVYGGGHGEGTYGVVGDSNDGNTGASNTGVGVFGRATNGAGVLGSSVSSNGVYGLSSTGYGVLGYSTGGSASLSGISSNVNIPAFAGGNSVAGGLAASFSGTVFVNGMFVVADMTQKHGLLKHPDGSHRLMYTVEAPESWAEDFGTGALVSGKADITLDPDFAALVHTQDYHVFVTEADGSHHHLSVGGKSATGFTVTADAEGAALKGKKATDLNGRFSYRIVAKPKSDKKVERLGKFTVPNVPLPDVSKLPKPTEPSAPPRKP